MSTVLSELSDLELLSSALRDAMWARGAGVIVGPELDEVALQRAARRARRADMAALVRAWRVPGGDAA